MIPLGNYFEDTIWHFYHVVSAPKVVCLNDKCGDQGSWDSTWHHLAATAGVVHA
jgi:hypothetical protein